MLLGRDHELVTLDDVLADLDSAGGKVVLLRGEAGIGKSALVTEFVDRQADEVHFLARSCDGLLIPQALGPFWCVTRAEPTIGQPLRQGDLES